MIEQWKYLFFHYLFYCAISQLKWQWEAQTETDIAIYSTWIIPTVLFAERKEGKTAWIFSNLANIKPQMSVEFSMLENVAQSMFQLGEN